MGTGGGTGGGTRACKAVESMFLDPLFPCIQFLKNRCVLYILTLQVYTYTYDMEKRKNEGKM